MSLYRDVGKRAFDAVAAFSGLVLASPVLALVGMGVALALGTPVLFRQERPGRGGKLFSILKFRTMSEARSADGSLLPDAERLGRFGRFLRATSLDELPELWNVLKGDMSLVGPRPLLVEYLPLYSERQVRRHDVRPGITGWAQVNGRNALTWEKKFEMDVWYVENLTFGLDVRIRWRPLVSVVRREGISAAGEATMSRFTGTVL